MVNENTMNLRFLIRDARFEDLEDLYRLSLANGLLNLPSDKEILHEKIGRSTESFAGRKEVKDRQFIFVLEDQETGKVTGTSTLFSDYADQAHPFYYYSVYDADHPAPDMDVPAGHQLLRLRYDTRPISALGGLVVDSRYRGLPEKRGKQISLIRFVMLGMRPELFHPTILSELIAPVEPDGRNLFWETIGQKYTGLDYETVFQLARMKDRNFIRDRFPKDDIVFTPAQKALHRTIRSVGDGGRAQQHMVARQGFRYLHQVDPMDGGLQYAAQTSQIHCIRNGRHYPCDALPTTIAPNRSALIGTVATEGFLGGQVPVSLSQDTLLIPGAFMAAAHLSPGERVYACFV